MTTSSEPATETSASPAISVAMATYQGERYLRLQLDTIAQQTLLPQELVITDDNSADCTLEIVQEFAGTAPFSVSATANTSRLRYADNFLRAASLCTQDLIAFCDQDDLWQPQKLRTCAAEFADPAVLLVLHAAQTFSDAGTLGHHFPAIAARQVLESGQSDPLANRPGFAMVARRELVTLATQVNRPVALYSHDHWIWFLAAAAGRIAVLPDVLTLYRQHEANVYGAGDKKTLRGQLKVGVEIPNYADVYVAELECAEALRQAELHSPGAWVPAIRRSIERLVLRAKFHRVRSNLYAANRSFLRRIGDFMQLLAGGAYLPDPSRTRMGPQAGAKDLILGVFRLFRGANP